MVGKMADFGRKLACRLVISRVRVLGSGPHTPTQFFLGGRTPPTRGPHVTVCWTLSQRFLRSYITKQIRGLLLHVSSSYCQHINLDSYIEILICVGKSRHVNTKILKCMYKNPNI